MNLYINCVDNDISFNKKNYLMRAAKRMNYNFVIDYNLIQAKPNLDYVLNIEPYDQFVKGELWTGLWNIDLLLDKDWKLSDWAVADTVFTAIGHYPRSTEGFKDKMKILFQACDPILHRRMPEVKQEYDFVLCGTQGLDIYTERRRLIAIMADKFTYKDYGMGYVPEKYVLNYNTAKVQWIRSMGKKPEEGELAQRFFECMAIGPVLTNETLDLPHTGFVESYDYLSYKSDDEMIKKMQLLLDNPKMAAALAANARHKSLLYHTYENRLITILQTIEHDKKNT